MNIKKLLLFTALLLLNAANPLITFAAKKAIVTKNAPAPIGAYSQAIRVGNTVYISGQIGIDTQTGEIVKGSFKDQFKQALTYLSEIAKAAGGSLDDIVRVTVYVTDLSNFSVINEVMKEAFHPPYPARVAFEVKSLAKHADVEIDAVMIK